MKSRKMRIMIFSLICFILMSLIYNYLVRNGEISIKYKSPKEGSIQIFYDNHNIESYPFDEVHSLKGRLLNTGAQSKIVTLPLSLKYSNKIRIDIDGILEKIELDSISLSTIGLNLKNFLPNDIVNEFDIVNDGQWNYENNTLTIRALGDDLFFGNINIKINFITIWIISVGISVLITLLLFKIFSIMEIDIKVIKVSERILVILFICLISLPNVVYQLMYKNLEKSSENRVLKEKPSITINNIMNYTKEYEEYYNDNLAFKDSLVRLNSIIKYEVLNVSPAKYVIKGKDEWLFYNSKYKLDADTLGDYQHTNKFTIDELVNIKNKLVDREKFLKEKGIEMYLFIPPNKSQVYSEFMPAKYKKPEGSSRIEELIDYLRKNTDIKVVNPMKELMNYKSKYQLYYKLDTHWNELGAYIGYTELMKTIDKNFKYKNLSELEIISNQTKNGDLANMINLSGIVSDTQYIVSDFKIDINTTLVEQKGTSEYRYTSTNLNGKKLLCFRDSFSTSVIPYLSKEFEESVYLWGVPYSEEIIEKEKPDIVIFETVERLANFN